MERITSIYLDQSKVNPLAPRVNIFFRLIKKDYRIFFRSDRPDKKLINITKDSKAVTWAPI